MSINAGTVVSYLELDTGKFTSTLKSAGNDLKIFANKSESLSKKISALSSSLQTTGTTLTTFVTVPLIGAGVAFTKFAGDFEESSNKVATIADTTVMSIKDIQEGVLELSDEMGIAANELNEALYQTISATGDTANALEYVEIASKAAIGGFTDTATAIDGLTTVMNAYRLVGRKAMQEVSDQMLMAQNYGKTTFGEMASSIGNVIPIAASLNVSTKELFGSIATLTKNGIATSEAVTGLKAALSNVIKPSKQASELAYELGLEFNAAHLKSVGWAQFLDEVREKTGGNTEKMAQLFGSVEALNAVTVLATTGAEDFAGALDAMENSAGSTQKAFETMEQGINDGIGDMLNSLKNLGIELGQVLIPYVMKVIEKVQEWINWFKGLNDSTKEVIVKIGMVVAAIGPLLLVLGKIIAIAPAVGTAFTVMTGPIGLVVAAIAGLIAAIVACYKNWDKLKARFDSLSGIGKIFTAFLVVLNPVALAITGITASIKMVQHAMSDAIPEIQRFGPEISKSTQEAVGAFLDLNDQATVALNQLSWSGQTVTQEMTINIVNNFSQMAKQVQEGLDKYHQESLSKMQNFVNNSTSLSKEEQQQILQNMQQGYEDKKKAVKEGEDRIKEILETASAEKRALTKEEQEEINSIQREMVDTGIRVLSENELEAKAIMERMKQNAGDLSARQAAEVVQNSLKQKEETIKAAEEQYNEVIKEIIRQRDEAGTISEEQAQKLIEEAKRQRDETIRNAEEMHNKVVEEAKKQAEEHVDKVNWETGEILSNWEVFRNNLKEKWENIKKDTSEKLNQMLEDAKTKFNEIKTSISTKVDETKANILNTWDNIKNDLVKKWNNLKSDAVDIFKNIADAIVKPFKNIHIPMPHFDFSVSYKKIAGISFPVPDIDVEWYDKGGIFSRPTIIGVGEKRPEFVGALEDLRYLIRDELNHFSDLKLDNDILNAVSTEKTLSITKYENNVQEGRTNIDYDKLGRALAKYIKPSINMEAIINSPQPLTPSKVRQEQEVLLKQLAMEWGV